MKLFNKVKSKLFKETSTKIEILQLLNNREMYGYEVWREISKMKEMHVQAIYTHLRELERERLVRSRKESYKTYYKITTKGRKYLRRGVIPKRKTGKYYRCPPEEPINSEKMICYSCGEGIEGTPYITPGGIFCNKMCAYHFKERKLLYGREKRIDWDKVFKGVRKR